MAAGWTGSYRSAATTPLEPDEIMAGHLLFVAFRLVTSSAAFIAVMARVRRHVDGWWAVWRPGRRRCSPGLAFAAPIAAWAVTVNARWRRSTRSSGSC